MIIYYEEDVYLKIFKFEQSMLNTVLGEFIDSHRGCQMINVCLCNSLNHFQYSKYSNCTFLPIRVGGTRWTYAIGPTFYTAIDNSEPRFRFLPQ